MADEKNGNGQMRTIATVIVSALATALITLLLNSKANERQIEANTENLKDLQRRMTVQETQSAGVRAELSALQSKVDDIWKVTVMGERPRGK